MHKSVIEAPTTGRRVPRQGRAKEMVEAIIQAGLLVLRDEGHESLTTKRIAERAGVSVGSLYQYFGHKDDVLESIYRRQHEEFYATAATWFPKLRALPLETAVSLIVTKAIERHARLHALHPEFYRGHSIRYTLSTFNPDGPDLATQWVGMVLEGQRDELTSSPDRAAFLLTRALGNTVVATLRERPHYLREPAFRDEMLRMALALVTKPPE